MSVLKYKDPTTGEYKPVIGGDNSGSNVSTPDWLQNDETASDYIKNRPFYEGLSVLLPETTLTFTNSQYAGNLGLNFEEGETYTIVWDGVEYKCVAFYFDNGTVHGNAVGNLAAAGGTNTGEPFFMGTAAGEDGYTMAACLTGAASATLKVLGKTLKKIDEKYLPAMNNIAYIPVYFDSELVFSTTVTVGELAKMISEGKMVVAKIYNTNVSPTHIHYFPMWYHAWANTEELGFGYVANYAFFGFGSNTRCITLSLDDNADFNNLLDLVYVVDGKL